MQTQKIIVIRPRTNRRYTCEFSINMFESYGADTQNERRIATKSRDFKSPLRAQKFVDELIAEGGAVSLHSRSSAIELQEMCELWETENAKNAK